VNLGKYGLDEELYVNSILLTLGRKVKTYGIPNRRFCTTWWKFHLQLKFNFALWLL